MFVQLLESALREEVRPSLLLLPSCWLEFYAMADLQQLSWTMEVTLGMEATHVRRGKGWEFTNPSLALLIFEFLNFLRITDSFHFLSFIVELIWTDYIYLKRLL